MSRHQVQAEAASAVRAARHAIKGAQRLEAMLRANETAAEAGLHPLPFAQAIIEVCARGVRMDTSAAEAAAREAAIYSHATTTEGAT